MRGPSHLSFIPSTCQLTTRHLWSTYYVHSSLAHTNFQQTVTLNLIDSSIKSLPSRDDERRNLFHHPWSPNTWHVGHVVPKCRLGCQAQLTQATGCERGAMGTYLGNLCFSFLRLCLVGGTDTRHWAISSYWALVSIMMGQESGRGERQVKNTLGSNSLRAGKRGVGTQDHSAKSSTSLACP